MSVPDPNQVAAAFQALRDSVQNDGRSAHRHLVTALYSDPRKWHSIRDARGDSLFLAAVRVDLPSTAAMLLKKNFSATAWNDDLDTALHLSASAEMARIVLAASGPALALEANAAGDLPLHVALRDKNIPVADVLLSLPTADAQVLRRNIAGETPLFDAARRSPGAALRMLLLGADPRVKNKLGQQPADQCRNKRAARLLKAFCAHLDRCDADAAAQARRGVAALRNLSLAERARSFLDAAQQNQSGAAAALSDSAAP